ncbi:MAG: SLC13 family permease [Planctomycetota bacterium]
MQGEPQALRTVDEDGDFLLIEGVEKTLTIPKKAPLAIAILVGVITLGALGVASFALLAVAGAALMLLTRCLTTRNAMRALDPAVLLLIAAMIPLGIAMERTGLASQIAQGVFGVVGESSPQLLLAVVYLLTFVLTEFVSNNATAVLMTPICIGMATHLGMDPKPFLVAVTFGASASFSTPIGYQTNTMVMGPGGYTFRDFLRIGLPLNLVLWVAASLLIPLFWEM